MNATNINIPKRGWQQELAKMAECTVQTVVKALHHDGQGAKCDRVRMLYNKKYNSNK